MKKIFGFLMLSCLVTMVGGTAVAVQNQAVKMDAVRMALGNAPSQMDKQKFLDALESCNVVTVQELLTACTKSIPANVACTECKVFITDIINYHNGSLNPVNIGEIPNLVVVVNPDGNNTTNPNGDGNNITSPNGSGNNTTNPNGDGNNITNPNDGGNNIVNPGLDTMPKTFKSVCEADGGKYSTGKNTYNQISYDGEWCGGNKTACGKLFKDTGISVRGVADNKGKIYCFVGSEKDNYQMPPNRVLPDVGAKLKTKNCEFAGLSWQDGIKTYKVTCNPDNPFGDNALGKCLCTCNHGKWNCVREE